MKERNVKTYIYSIIVVLSFILVAIGTSLAIVYYKVSGNDDNGGVDVSTTAYVTAAFQQTHEFNEIDVFPGWSDTMEFEILNTSTELNAVGRYTLILNIEKNELASPDFVYNIVGTSTLDGVEIEEKEYTNKVINKPEFVPVPTISTTLGSGIINTGVRHSYILTVKINETGVSQNELQGKTFKANVVAKGE